MVATPASAIPGLTWSTNHFELDIRDVNSKDRIVARLSGTFIRPGWTLIIANRVVRPDSSGKFDLSVPVQGVSTPVSIYCISDYGKPQNAKVDLKVSPSDLALINQKSRWILSAGLGLTSLTYNQTGVSTVNQITTTVKFAVAHDITRNQRWFATFSGYGDVLPISDNQNSQLRFLGLNGRIDYSMPQVTDPWKLNFAFGWYYVTTFGNENYGFTNMMGPQVYPTARYYFKNENYISTYAKYSPVVSGAKVLPFSSREIAAGVGYGIPLANKHVLSINFDYASLDLQLDSSTASTRSMTLGFSYSL